MRRALLLTLLGCAGAHAQPSTLLDPMFGEHAVLQRGRPVAVWGRAPAGEAVEATLGAAKLSAVADGRGRWQGLLPAMAAGGPFTLTARTASGAAQVSGDILVGDVFLCSGQSNMELAVLRAADSGSEIHDSADPAIHMLTIAHASSARPLEQFQQPVSWEVAGPQTVPDWSAVCFFYARELRKTARIPIGLVHSSWGGANIRPWMSAAALHEDGGYEGLLALLPLYADDPAAAQRRFAARWEDWWRAKTHESRGAEPWNAIPAAARKRGKTGGNPTVWRPAPAALKNWREWGNPELRDFTGLVWFRTTIHLRAAQARAGANLVLGPINQVDQTWINGRAIGNTFGYGTERRYRVPPGVLRAGDNVVVTNVLSTYGGGGLLEGGEKRALRFAGGESVALDGPWEFGIVPAGIGYPPRAPWESVGGLTTLYNAMIAPLGPFGFRAALWYQGESNTGEAQTYRALLTELMADWRRQFGADLAFLVVQLPNYGQPPAQPSESGWSEVREAQRMAVAADPRAGLAVTIDIGDAHNLHPTNKQDVARRLARAARHVIYGEPTAPSGPAARAAWRRAGAISIEFADVEGALVAYSHQGPIGFELCGRSAGTCRYAEARIDGVHVAVLAPGNLGPELEPTRVRYCWGDSPICTLFDSSGLPAGPFELEIHGAP